jgi:hypothetical protein
MKDVRIINRQTGHVKFVSEMTAQNTHILASCGYEVEELAAPPSLDLEAAAENAEEVKTLIDETEQRAPKRGRKAKTAN